MKFKSPKCESCPYVHTSLFGLCKGAELDDVMSAKSSIQYKKGQYIFYQNSRAAGIHCIHSGRVKVTRVNNDGKEQIIRLAYPGDNIGYRSLMADSDYSASAIAMEDSVVCFIPKEVFSNLIRTNPEINAQLIRLLSVKLGEAQKAMTNMALKPVRERLAEALLVLSKTYNAEKNFTINIRREDLAHLVGTAKETTIRLLSQFKQENIISSSGRSIKILDRNKLVRICDQYD